MLDVNDFSDLKIGLASADSRTDTASSTSTT